MPRLRCGHTMLRCAIETCLRRGGFEIRINIVGTDDLLVRVTKLFHLTCEAIQ